MEVGLQLMCRWPFWLIVDISSKHVVRGFIEVDLIQR